MNDTAAARLETVVVIGAGLLGASVGCALTAAGVKVHLRDAMRTHAVVAASRGAGTVSAPVAEDVDLVVVAVPPLAIPEVVEKALVKYPKAVVTDVGSVKAMVIARIESHGVDASRYVGSHPMAGTAFAGPITAGPDLFHGRTWVITPTRHNAAWAVDRVVTMAEACDARTKIMNVRDHDRAVAEVSHLPQIMASLTAARLGNVPRDDLALAGTGLRDVTRIAGSEPALWRQIITANRDQVLAQLKAVHDDLGHLIEKIDDAEVVESVIARGRRGVRLLPGKHGRRTVPIAAVVVEIPDEPGSLARLFADIDRVGVNVEDVRIEHDPDREIGYLAVQVDAARAETLRAAMRDHGWQLRHGAEAPEPESEVDDMSEPLVIAIDGPSGVGKSSTARGVASRLGIAYLDTGAMYRAVTWMAMHDGVDLDDAPTLTKFARECRIAVGTDPANPMISINDHPVEAAIREPVISRNVSKIATVRDIRNILTDQMRAIIASTGRIVVEGRDITTVVAPDAQVRVLLVADPEARMGRRQAELVGELSRDQLVDQIVRRDRDDATMSQFETPAEGVTLLDSTYLSLAEVVQAVIDLVPDELLD